MYSMASAPAGSGSGWSSSDGDSDDDAQRVSAALRLSRAASVRQQAVAAADRAEAAAPEVVAGTSGSGWESGCEDEPEPEPAATSFVTAPAEPAKFSLLTSFPSLSRMGHLSWADMPSEEDEEEEEPPPALADDAACMDIDELPMYASRHTRRAIGNQLKRIRKPSFRKRPTHSLTAESDVEMAAGSLAMCDRSQASAVYLIVDTNFLLSHLRWMAHFKQHLLEKHISIVIPWTVMQELDILKSNMQSTVGVLARQANKQLLLWFRTADRAVVGEQVFEDAPERDRSDPFQRTNDDNVLLCCLYFRDLGYRVMLLSDDNNLCCKALVHNVATLSKDELPDPDHADALLEDMLHLPEPQQAQSRSPH